MSNPPLVPTKAAVEEVRAASQQWGAALRSFDDYRARLRALADAASRQSRALKYAELANVKQDPRRGASAMRALAPELDPTHDRPGPTKLWRRFDSTVKQLGAALEAGHITAIADSFAELSGIAHELADACEAEVDANRGRSRTA